MLYSRELYKEKGVYVALTSYG